MCVWRCFGVIIPPRACDILSTAVLSPKLRLLPSTNTLGLQTVDLRLEEYYKFFLADDSEASLDRSRRGKRP